jgi:lysophospholipase L1-like esterase
VSLEIRDVDVRPDLVVVFSGINDLQPAGHKPFSPDYSVGHADILRRVTGVTPIPMSLAARSVFIEWLLGRVAARRPGETAPAGYSPSYDWKGGPKSDDIPAEALVVYERNLRSTIAVARAHGAETLLVAQTARVRAGHEAADRAWLEALSPGLTTAGYLAGLKRYNAVEKKLGDEGLALFLDPFAAGPFGDESFSDPAHFSPAGSALFARTLASYVEAPGGPMAARRE